MTNILATPVLVLNKNFIPIATTSVKKAVSKLLKGTCEVVSVNENHSYELYDFDSWTELSEFRDIFETDYWLKSFSKTFPVPRVIRSLKYNGVQSKLVRLTRKGVLERDDFTCMYCGKRGTSETLNIDHVKPQSRGGLTSWINLVASCYHCNNKKGARTPEEANIVLLRNPYKPFNSGLKLSNPKHRYKDWDAFISYQYWNVELKD